MTTPVYIHLVTSKKARRPPAPPQVHSRPLTGCTPPQRKKKAQQFVAALTFKINLSTEKQGVLSSSQHALKAGLQSNKDPL